MVTVTSEKTMPRSGIYESDRNSTVRSVNR